jgi:CTP:phosphocholine cytidylyltransferase-like protein
MLETRHTKTPHYVVRVNYKAKGMTERTRKQRRIDPRSLPGNCPYDHRFHTMFQFDFCHSVVLYRDPVVAKSQWIDWDHVRKQKKPSLDVAIETCQHTSIYELM